MRNFVGYASNGKFSVGCTGGTVYLFDENENLINKFQDIKYAYCPKISPDGRLLVVKSAQGKLAVYSLENFSLINKFRFSKVDGAQDDDFFFTPDAKKLVNIERQEDSLHQAITVYNTEDFSIVSRLLLNEFMVIDYIDFESENEWYVLGAYTTDFGYEFVARYENNTLTDITKISHKDFALYMEHVDSEESNKNYSLKKLYTYYRQEK